MNRRTVEAHVEIGHYSTKKDGPEACLRAIAIIEYSIRGANGTPCVEVGKTKFNMTVTEYMKAQIGLSVDDPQKRVLENLIVTFPNEATEFECRYIATTFLTSLIGDSEAIGRLDFHFKPKNSHGHMQMIDGLESLASAQERAAERDAQRNDGKKTRVRRRNQLRFKELFYREPGTLSPDDPGQKMKSYIKQKWAEHVNECCRKFGIPVHFEHRSRAARGLPGKGTIHLGPQSHAMIKKLQSAELYEMRTGKIANINPRVVATAEHGMSLIDKNRAILASREIIQEEWSLSEQMASESINDTGRSIAINTNPDKEDVRTPEVKAALQIGQQIQIDLFDENHDQHISNDVLNGFGIDANQKLDATFAPHVPSVFENIVNKKKRDQSLKVEKPRPHVDHKKGFVDAMHLLGKSLIKRDRKNARRAILRASYHCSGAFEIANIDEKQSFIRNRLSSPVRNLFDTFVAGLKKSVRKRIFCAKPLVKK